MLTLGKARRRELGKFVLDLGRVTFGGTVVTQLFSATAGSTAILLAGFGVTIVAVIVGLAIVPEDWNMSASEWGFIIIALFVIVFAAISYLVVKVWGEKKRS